LSGGICAAQAAILPVCTTGSQAGFCTVHCKSPGASTQLDCALHKSWAVHLIILFNSLQTIAEFRDVPFVQQV
jgi:hypothetical protein